MLCVIGSGSISRNLMAQCIFKTKNISQMIFIQSTQKILLILQIFQFLPAQIFIVSYIPTIFSIQNIISYAPTMSQPLRSFKDTSLPSPILQTQRKERLCLNADIGEHQKLQDTVERKLNGKLQNFDCSSKGLRQLGENQQSEDINQPGLNNNRLFDGKIRRQQENQFGEPTIPGLESAQDQLPNTNQQNRLNLIASIPDISIQSNHKHNALKWPFKTFKYQEGEQSKNQYQHNLNQQATQRIISVIPKVLTHEMLAETQRIIISNPKLSLTKNSHYEQNKIQSIIQILAAKNRTDLIDILQSFRKLIQSTSNQNQINDQNSSKNDEQNKQNAPTKNQSEDIQAIILEIDNKINRCAKDNTKFQHFIKIFNLKQKRLVIKTKRQFQHKLDYQLSQYENQLNQIVEPLLKLKSTIQELSQCQSVQQFCEKTKEIKESKIFDKKLQQVQHIDISQINNSASNNQQQKLTTQFNSPQNTNPNQMGVDNGQKKQQEVRISKWKQRLQNLLSSIKNKTYKRRQRCNSIESNDASLVGQIVQNKQQSKQSQIKPESKEDQSKQQANLYKIKPFKVESQQNKSVSAKAVKGQNIMSALIPDSMKTINNIYYQFKFIYRFLLQILYYEQNYMSSSKFSPKPHRSKYHKQLKQEIENMYNNFSNIKIQVEANIDKEASSNENSLHLLYTQIQRLNLFIHKCTIKVPEIRKLWKKSIKSSNTITIQQLETVHEQDKENMDTSNILILRN